MKIGLYISMAFMLLSQDTFGTDLLGKWNGPSLEFYQRTQISGGGEDHAPHKIDLKRFSAKFELSIELEKDGTGTYRSSNIPKHEKSTFTWILTGSVGDTERSLFIAFDEPMDDQTTPLLVLSVKQSSQDQLVLSTISKNSLLGDGIHGFKFVRSKKTKTK